VSRTEGGVKTEYLYGNPANAFEVTATRGPGGLTRFYRDDGGAVFAFSRGGQRYLVASDQVGSATAIADASGAVVKAISYDSFGVVRSDSDPAFPYPFGFAGGLADETTGLVRFGLRDYDPEAGRWTARDPSLDSTLGGNLYAYVGNDPVNRADPAGLYSIGLSAYKGIGGGISLAFTSEGFSVCGEVGVGVEASLEFNPEAGLEAPRYGLFGEAELDMGGIASASLQMEHVIPCAPGSKPTTPGRRDLKFKPEICITYLCAEGSEVKASGDPWKEFKPKLEPGFGFGGKVGARVCNQVRW
jgi:RHS repeat-associated protein